MKSPDSYGNDVHWRMKLQPKLFDLDLWMKETLQNLGQHRSGKYVTGLRKDMNEIEKERARIQEELHCRGFQGEYPRFGKKGMEVLAVEEHPFTLGFMEWEKFDFRIRLMISKDSSGKKRNLGVNGGFFKGKGREGQIENAD